MLKVIQKISRSLWRAILAMRTRAHLQMLAAVAAAVRWVFVSKKSMNVRDAARPLARRSGSGCSTASLLMA